MHATDVIIFRVATRSFPSPGIEVIAARSVSGPYEEAVLSAAASDGTVAQEFCWLDFDSEFSPAGVVADVRQETSEDGNVGVDSRVCKSEASTIEASDPVVEYDKLIRCDDIDDVRLFTTGESDDVISDQLLVCDNGRKNNTVLDLRRVCRSTLSFSSPSTVLLTSSSLYSSFPSLSDAKYSSPRPKTT